MIPMIILLFTFSPITTYAPLNIVFLSGYGRLEYEKQQQMSDALKWFSSAIHVSNFKSTSSLDDVTRGLPEYKSITTIFLQSTNFAANFHTKDPQFHRILASANYLIVQHRNRTACHVDQHLLANMMPIGEGIQRPRIGRLVICEPNHISKYFRNYYDLFRHEILHGLGFGMYETSLKSKKSPPTEIYTWNTPWGSQKATRTYLDFGNTAVKEARNHFGCSKVRGIESDGINRQHLNEYIFGNELMTPIVENSRNYFSNISAAILENTFLGETPWYTVNRTFTNQEASKYWYARNLGCDFLHKSCYDFVKKAKNPTFPLCSKNNHKHCLKNQDLKIHLSNSKCHQNIGESQPKIADNGITSTIGHAHSSPIYRFCEFDENMFTPFDFKIEKC